MSMKTLSRALPLAALFVAAGLVNTQAAVTTFWSAGTGCSGPSSASIVAAGAPVQFSLCATTTGGDGVCGATIVPEAPDAASNGHFTITNRILNRTLLPDPTAGDLPLPGATPITYPIALTRPATPIRSQAGLHDWGGTVSAAAPPLSSANQVLATFSFAATPAANEPAYVVGLNEASVVTTSASNCLLAGADTPITATLTLNVEPDTLQFAQASYSVTEGSPVATSVSVTRSGTLTNPASVVWTTANDSALVGSDFGSLNNTSQRTGTLNWAANDGSPKTVTVGLATSNIPVINNNVVQPNRGFFINLSSPTGDSLGSQSSTNVTIVEDDSSIQFIAPAVTLSEAGPDVTLQVVRTGSTAVARSITWTTANGTAMAGSDFGAKGSAAQSSGTITFGVGDAGPKVITIGPTTAPAPFIPIIQDTTVEGPESFTVKLVGTTVGTANTATVTVLSTQLGVAMDAATRSFPEGAGAVSIQVDRLGPSTGAMSVGYAFANGTAVNGTHFIASPGTLTWADGDASPKQIPVTLIDNGGVNTAHAFTVALSAPSGATLIAPMSTVVTINDDDTSIQFSSAAVSTSVAAPSVSLTVTRTGITANPSSVSYAASNGSAIAGLDFGTLGNSTPPSGTVAWAAGDAASKTIVIPILHDPIPGAAKGFTVALSNPVGANASLGSTSTEAVTITDTDAGVAFEFPAYSVTEGTASVTVRAVRVGATSAAASATWTAVNGTAIAGRNFGTAGNFALPSGAVSWVAGDATAKNIVIPILDDKFGGQGDLAFRLNLVPGTGILAGIPPTATVTIHDNEPPPHSTIGFAQAKYVVSEGAGSVLLTLRRSDAGGGFGLPASVTYTTVAGSALAAIDFTAKTGTVSWAAGDSSDKTLSVAILHDTTAKPNRTFRVSLSAVSSGASASLGLGPNSTASVLIVDDDEVFPAAGTFPPDGTYPPGWSVPAGADAGWHAYNDASPFEGAYVLRTDQIRDGQTAAIEVAGTFATGLLTFQLKVSSEAGADVLSLLVDGIEVGTWSGTTVAGWQKVSVPIVAGPHVVRWSYQKDASMSAGQDAMSIDAVSLPGYAP